MQHTSHPDSVTRDPGCTVVIAANAQNQWVNNIQVTLWIMAWVSLAGYLPALVRCATGLLGGAAGAALPSVPSPAAVAATIANLPAALRAAFSGFTPAVWGVVLLKALNGILIPATFKYADNLIYSYARPSSIVVTCLFGAVMARAVPPLTMLAGVAIVVTSIGLYNSKPAEKTA